METQDSNDTKEARSLHGLVCVAPPVTPDADGWWWLWCDEQWCPASVTYYDGYTGARLRVKWLRKEGGMSADTLRPEEVAAEVWGGRLAVPGARKSDVIDDVFPGSGEVTRAIQNWREERDLFPMGGGGAERQGELLSTRSGAGSQTAVLMDRQPEAPDVR